MSGLGGRLGSCLLSWRVSPLRLGQPVGLILDLDSDLGQRVRVLAAMVGAKKQLTSTGKHNAHVGLRTAPVAEIVAAQWLGSGYWRSHRSGHVASLA